MQQLCSARSPANSGMSTEGLGKEPVAVASLGAAIMAHESAACREEPRHCVNLTL